MTLDTGKLYADINDLQQQHADAITAAVNTQRAADQAIIDQLKARIAELEAQPQPQAKTGFGVNGSNLKQIAANLGLFDPVDFLRYYHQPGEGVKWPEEVQLNQMELVYSSKVSPKDVAAGKADAGYRALFAAAPKDRSTYVCVWHEPEDDIEAGHFASADLKAAWARITPLARAAGPHIKLLPIVMNATLNGVKGRKVADYLPDEYDVFGLDAYIAGNIGGGVASIPTMFDKTLEAAGKHPVLVCETGVGTKVSGADRDKALAAVVKTAIAKGLLGVIYFNNAEWTLNATTVKPWNAARAA